MRSRETASVASSESTSAPVTLATRKMVAFNQGMRTILTHQMNATGGADQSDTAMNMRQSRNSRASFTSVCSTFWIIEGSMTRA